MTIRKTAFAAVRWTGAAMLGRSAVAVLQIIILSRILNPTDFKLVAIAITIVNIGMVFTDMGISNAIIRFREITSFELVNLFWLNIMLGVAISSVVAATSPMIAHFYGDPRLVPLVLVASSIFVITAFSQQHRAVAEKDLRFDILFRIDLISAAFGFGVAISMALHGFGACSIIYGNVANALSVSILCWAMLSAGFKPYFAFSVATSKRFLSFASYVVFFQMFNAIALNGDIILGGRVTAGSALGYYFQPRDLCLRIMFVINPIVTRVSFPLLASVAHDKPKIRSVYLKTLNMVVSVNFPIYAFIAVFNHELVEIVLGPKWTESAPIMRVIAIWCAARSIGYPAGSLLLAIGRSKRAMVCAAGVAVAVLVFVYLGSGFGILGIPLSLTALYMMLIPTFWAIAIRPACGAGFAEYHHVLLLPAVAAVCAATAGMAVLELNLFASSIARLAVGGATVSVAYVASSWVLNREWLMSMKELLMLNRLRQTTVAESTS